MKTFRVLLPVFLVVWLTGINCLYSQDRSYYNGLAKTEFEAKNYYNVLDYANKSIAVTPNGEAYWWRAMARYHLKNYSDAIADFTSAIPYYSSDRSALGRLYSWRGDCRYDMRLYREAISDYELALSYGVENRSKLYWNLGGAQHELQEEAKAIDAYSSAIGFATNNSDLSRLYKLRGDAKAALKKYEEAITDFSKAVELDNRYARAFWQRSFYRAQNSQYELAIGDCTAAILLMEQENTGPSNDLAILYNNRGNYRYSLGQYEDARTDLQKSLTHSPTYDYANWNMAKTAFALRNFKEAGSYYLQAVALMKKETDRASCYRELHRTDRAQLEYGKALAHINEAIRIMPASAVNYWERAKLLTTRKEYINALADYDRIAELYKDSVNLGTILTERGQLKGRMKDMIGGLSDVKRAVELSPTYDNYYELGRYYRDVLQVPSLAAAPLQQAVLLAEAGEAGSGYVYAKAVKGEQVEAISTMERLLGNIPPESSRLKWELHNAACVYALTGYPQKAIQYVEKSFVAGYDDLDHLVNDRDLESLNAFAAYRALLAKYKVPAAKY